MRTFGKSLLVFFLGVLTPGLQADQGPVRLAAMVMAPPAEKQIFGTGWGMTLSVDGTGFYNDVIGLVLARMGQESSYLPLPYKRAKVEFANDHASCLYPSNIEHLSRGGEINPDDGYVQTAPLIWVESHLFSRPDTAPLASLAALEGKKVAYPNGSALPTVLAHYGPDFLPTTDESTKARMLIAGRVDYMSGSLPDNVFVFKAIGRPLPPYNPDLALIRIGVAIVCHDTPANYEFVRRFDAELHDVMTSGDMADLFEQNGVDLRFLPGR